MMKILQVFLLLFLLINDALSSRKIEEKDYFVSLRSNETNVRAGPGQHYPIKFIFKAKNVPLHVVSEFDNWNEVEDYEGQTGWISKSLLTKRRSLMVQTAQDVVNLYSKRNENSRILFKLKNHVIGDYIGCEKEWCMMEVENKRGWIKRNLVFGD